jgi:hypothetical protein
MPPAAWRHRDYVANLKDRIMFTEDRFHHMHLLTNLDCRASRGCLIICTSMSFCISVLNVFGRSPFPRRLLARYTQRLATA